MKLFCVSDIHGFYDKMIEALNEAGFDPENENHLLISCGDNFDRSSDPDKVMNYLMKLPRKVLIKGNHETLLEECIARGYPCHYDWHNGTARTIIDLAPDAQTFDEACTVVYEKVKDFIGNMVDYYETEHYVFCHGYLPINKHRDWREATSGEWEKARWRNGMEMVDFGYSIDKCVVCGHYHTSWGRATFEEEPEFGEGADFSPYYYEDKLIAIDACTAYSGKVNVLVLEDNLLTD